VHVDANGTITGHAPQQIPPGEHDADIAVQPIWATAQSATEAELRRRIRPIQDEVARLPVLDPRTPDEILGYNAEGLLD
jgi:hypothetical protein